MMWTKKKCWQMQFSAKRRAIPSEVKKLLLPSSLLCHNIQKKHRESLNVSIGSDSSWIESGKCRLSGKSDFLPLHSPARLQGVNLARCRVSSYSDRSDSKFAVWVYRWLPRRAITFRRVSRFRFSCRYFSNNVDMLISWKTELKLFSGLLVSSFPPANVP